MIQIQNIYYMLAYAYQVLSERGYEDLSAENFENTFDLLSSILEKGISHQVKQGLKSDYIPYSKPVTAPRGKINVSDSIKNRGFITKRLTCEFDEFDANIKLNQILKTASCLALQSKDVNILIKKRLKKAMLYFSGIDVLKPDNIEWQRINYNRNNAAYKMLINICYLLINSLLQSSKEGPLKMVNFIDDQKMHRLFEKFVLEYYKRHFPQLKPSASQIAWNTDDGVIDYLPSMKSDITLMSGKKTLIIDTKYYSRAMQSGQFDRKSVHSGNLYQIFSYVKNKDTDASGNVSGILLYAQTDEQLTPDFKYSLGGNHVWAKSLNLNLPFRNIASQLDRIIFEWYSNTQE